MGQACDDGAASVQVNGMKKRSWCKKIKLFIRDNLIEMFILFYFVFWVVMIIHEYGITNGWRFDFHE